MNVLAVVQYFSPDLGGAATRASNMVRGLTLNGCNVTIIAAFPHYPHGRIPKEYRWRPIRVELIGKVKVIRTFMPPIRSEGFFKRLILMGSFAISALFALPWIGKIDVIWTQSWVPGLLYGKIKRVPVAINVDDLTIEDLPGLNLVKEDSIIYKIGSIVYRLFYVKADAVTPISSGYVNTISKKYCVNENKIHVIRIGVNTNLFKIMKFNGEKKGKFRVIYAGVLGVGYDFEQIFSAARLLEENNENVEFVLHGQGECLPLVRRRIKELKLVNVKLSDKHLPSKIDVVNLLNSADALILPMKDYGRPYLGLPTKLYEYQAVGKPIICCSAGVPSDYVIGTDSGLVVAPGNYETLANAVMTLKANNRLAQALGTNGRKHVESEESIEAIGFKAKELLETLA